MSLLPVTLMDNNYARDNGRSVLFWQVRWFSVYTPCSNKVNWFLSQQPVSRKKHYKHQIIWMSRFLNNNRIISRWCCLSEGFELWRITQHEGSINHIVRWIIYKPWAEFCFWFFFRGSKYSLTLHFICCRTEALYFVTFMRREHDDNGVKRK